MRLVVREHAKITLADISKELGAKVSKLELKDDYFRVTINDGPIKNLVVYLRCQDMAGLFGLYQNIFDKPSNMKVTKEGIVYSRERELFKAGFNKARLQAAIKKELSK